VERYGARWNVVDPLVDAKREFVATAGPNALVVDVGCGTGRDLAWFT
jgi:ubiquinone/menaquinone biosynthesis C-methylase UbiE